MSENPTPTKPVQFDLTQLELTDIVLIDQISRGEQYNRADAVRMLDRIIVGGVRGRKIQEFAPLLGRLVAVINEVSNPKSTG